MLFSTLLMYTTLLACTLLIAVIVLRYDLYLKEPFYALILVTAFGAAFMWLAGQAQLFAIHRIHHSGQLVTNTTLAILAGTTEELGKVSAVALIALLIRRHFEDPLDGLIYGSFAGLGAALEESLHLLIDSGHPIPLPPQEPIRLAGHLIMGGIGGFGLGLIPVRHKHALIITPLCLLAAIALHTLWDVIAFDAAEYYGFTRKLKPWHTSSPVALMLVGMFTFRFLAYRGAVLSRAWLQVCDLRSRKGPPAAPPSFSPRRS